MRCRRAKSSENNVSPIAQLKLDLHLVQAPTIYIKKERFTLIITFQYTKVISSRTEVYGSCLCIDLRHAEQVVCLPLF